MIPRGSAGKEIFLNLDSILCFFLGCGTVLSQTCQAGLEKILEKDTQERLEYLGKEKQI